MTYEMYLAHHGIKGQHWGVKNGPPYPLKEGISEKNPPNTTKLNDVKKAFFISERPLDGDTRIPRVPKNFLTDNGYEDNETPRVCFADDVGKCLTALSSNVKGKTFSVYAPDDISKYTFYRPNKKAVPDSEVTGEMWVTNPIKVKKVGEITVIGDDGKPGMKYKYGNNTAELYGWEYKWSKKLKHSEEGGTNFKMEPKYLELSSVLASLDPEYLEHHGIKGQKWGVEHGPPYPLKNSVSARIKRAAKSVKNRVEQNRKERAAKQEAKEAKRRSKNPTLQDKINAMSNEELREKTERLRLENAYKRELPNEKQGESFLRKSSKALNELKAFGDAVSSFVEAGKKVSHAFGLDKLEGNDEDPTRRAGESLKDYTQRMAQLASLRKSRDTLSGPSSGSDSSSSKKEEKKDPTPTSTAKTAVPSSDYGWTKDRSEKEDSRVSSLREEAKKWNVDIDKPVEKVWDYSDKGNSWFKQTFSDTKPSNFSDWTKDDDDEKKKKGD